MPTATYEQLLLETLPQVIETEKQYDAVNRRLGDLVGKQKRRTADETKLMRLLMIIVDEYDRRNAMPPSDVAPHDVLQFLVEHSGKTADELLKPIFGQRSHVNEALNGKRKISAEHARKLGKLFCVSPGLFL